MTTTTAALLNRAADHLDALDHTATADPWRAVVTDTEMCDGLATVCDSPDHPTDEPHRIYDCCPTCGDGPALLKAADADLIVALRPVAHPLAVLFRDFSDDADDRPMPGTRHAQVIAMARAVLGEDR